MIIRVNVTQEDIENGDPQESESCPIALALARETGAPWDVLEDTISPVLLGYHEDEGEKYSLPEEARKFILDFDQEIPVEPFTFVIDTEEDTLDHYKDCP